MAREQEVKLSVLGENWAAIEGWLALSAAAPVATDTLRNTYFDTADGLLNQQRIALRIRQADGSWTQTLKTKGATARGVHDRQEWDWPVSGLALDFAALGSSPIARIAEQGALQPVFSTDFERKTWLWRDGDDEVEVALDRGAVRAGVQQAPLFEVELELKGGSALRLMEQAQSLGERCAVFLNPVSKAEQGYWLAGLYQPPTAVVKDEPPLDVWFRALGYFWLTGRAEFLSCATESLARVREDTDMQSLLDPQRWRLLETFLSGLVAGTPEDVRAQLLAEPVLGQCQLALARG
ncbi:MAG: adenylate cyclase [Alteromonadaceae bacterium]|nr:adenylate cyclase [Alteromonadaceae bacterium]